jgi:hypothetical protein
MQETAIQELDRAALTLLEALDQRGDELRPYLEPGHLEALQREVVNLRRALLGLEIGPLYWATPGDLLDSVATERSLPVGAAAARLSEMLSKRLSESGG